MSGMSNACARQRSSGHLAVLVWSTAKAGGAMLFRDESRGKPEWVGVNASEHLSFARLGKASRGKPRRKPESTFRDRRGASVNVVMVGSEPASQSKERGQRGRYPPTYHWRDRALSRPRPVLREAHVQFCEKPRAKLSGPTLPGSTSTRRFVGRAELFNVQAELARPLAPVSSAKSRPTQLSLPGMRGAERRRSHEQLPFVTIHRF